MSRKKWLLLIFLLAAGYMAYRLFYKSYSVSVVASDADAIVSVDTKRIINTLLWETITSPKKWKPGNIFRRSEKDTSWKDMVSVPDYLFVFHMKDQPPDAWYAVLDIKNENGFNAGLTKYQFTATSKNKWRSKLYPIAIYRSGDKLLIANSAIAREQFTDTVAQRLFVQKSFINPITLELITTSSSHVALYLRQNNWLQNDAILTANYNASSIKLAGTMNMKPAFEFSEAAFSVPGSSLFSFGIAQPPPAVYLAWPASSKAKTAQVMGLQPDSIFLTSNKSYSLELPGIVQRIDTAISYEYDEDFNQKERVVLNPVTEPAIKLMINGHEIAAIENYLGTANKLEQTSAGMLFTGMPLTKSDLATTDSTLQITSGNYPVIASDNNFNAVFFLRLNFVKIPTAISNYFPEEIKKFTQTLQLIDLFINKEAAAMVLKGTISIR